MDYENIAAAMLAEVGLSFEDVVDCGRNWLLGPPGFQMQIGEPHYRGTCSYPNPYNSMSRKKCLITLSGEVDCDDMLYILAHECGHVLQKQSSTPVYIDEYQAELYAIATFERHCGRPLPAELVASAKRNVCNYCTDRYREMGRNPTKGWDYDICAWCGFTFKGEDY